MGGDGGVIASNRLYLRGAGKACHTADRERYKKTQEEEHQECRETMRMCALKGEALMFKPNNHETVNGNSQKGGLTSVTSDNSIAVCPYGKLYEREAAIEALLRRKLNERSDHNGSEDDDSALGPYIRGLKDLHEVRFHLVPKSTHKNASKIEYVPTCPITGEELNGVQPAFAIIKSKKKSSSKRDENNDSKGHVNVLSERAVKEMGIENLQLEYGPFEQKNMIRLAPPHRELQSIKDKLSALRAEENQLKKSKKESKKVSFVTPFIKVLIFHSSL